MKELYQKYPKWFWLCGAIVLCIIVISYVMLQPATNNAAKAELIPNVPKEETAETEEKSGSKTVVVDVKGAVKNPGVYEIAFDGRVKDAITISGGFTAEADLNAINLAEKLKDEMVITVYKNGEAKQIASSGSAENSNAGQKINLNQASISDLQQVPGIGAAKAKAILEYREKEGLFQTINDLKNVSGIGEKTVEKLKEYVEV
ncbi:MULTISPECIES: helix-hairpin-helix domain-containing protein [Listeria]|uniref:helix-hairpin-helix domain-containing protein n=1 Tax=Listeria TaxID=1637 RepID=UPI000B5928A4|nr:MULTISPECIES: helix-hairpin-helix domain-containing protein [Listeria]